MRSEAIGQSEKLKGYVELITTEKNRLQTQVDKMLRLTAVEAGNLVMEKSRLTCIRRSGKTSSGSKMSSLKRAVPSGLKHLRDHPHVKGDALHLFNAVSNLLDNAVKYSEKDPLIVVRTMNAGEHLIITFTDNGIGMDKSEISMIFDKFYRVKQGDRHDVKGFGLGLSYVKRIAELHGGFVEVSSQPGAGSVFSLHLPVSA